MLEKMTVAWSEDAIRPWLDDAKTLLEPMLGDHPAFREILDSGIEEMADAASPAQAETLQRTAAGRAGSLADAMVTTWIDILHEVLGRGRPIVLGFDLLPPYTIDDLEPDLEEDETTWRQDWEYVFRPYGLALLDGVGIMLELRSRLLDKDPVFYLPLGHVLRRFQKPSHASVLVAYPGPHVDPTLKAPLGLVLARGRGMAEKADSLRGRLDALLRDGVVQQVAYVPTGEDKEEELAFAVEGTDEHLESTRAVVEQSLAEAIQITAVDSVPAIANA